MMVSPITAFVVISLWKLDCQDSGAIVQVCRVASSFAACEGSNGIFSMKLSAEPLDNERLTFV